MLYQNQSCELLVLGYHKNLHKNTVWMYSPEDSNAKEFLHSEGGRIVLQMFKTFIEKEECKLRFTTQHTTSNLVFFWP